MRSLRAQSRDLAARAGACRKIPARAARGRMTGGIWERRRWRCWFREGVLPSLPALGQWAATPLSLSLLATVFLVIATLAGPGPSLSDWLGDTDDAVRLVTVRELLGGAPWFDTTLPRIGAPEPLVSHWSRLIDLPLAALIGTLTPLLGPERAELATRIVWPTLLFFALALIVAREAHRRAGPVGAAFAVMLVATSTLALAQFRPGRIDHHNAQILCAVAGLIFLVRSLDDRRAGWIAGILLGLGLAIGYEAIALVVPALGLAALATVWLQRDDSSAERGRRGARCGSRGGDAVRSPGRDHCTVAMARRALRCVVAQPRAPRRLRCGRAVGGNHLERQANRPLGDPGRQRGGRRRPLRGPGAGLPRGAVRANEPGSQVALARPRDGDQEHALARRQPSRAGAGGGRVRACRRRRADRPLVAAAETSAQGWPRRSSSWLPCSGAGRSS